MADTETIVSELYRGIFGREPDPDGLRHHAAGLRQGRPMAHLVQDFIASPEFAARSGQPPSGALQRVDGEPPLRIDLDLNAEQMARLWAHVGTTWATLGHNDPYWSVLTDPRFRLPNMADAAVLNLFYESGQADLNRLDAWLRRNGGALRADMVCAEYGCGVGRLTGWLARRCRRARAFDISPTHLAHAAKRLQGQNVRNVDFQLVRSPTDLGRLAGMDLFFSAIVLQHNPPPIMQLILDRAFAHLKPGGLAFFQLPTYARGYQFDLERYLADMDRTLEMEMHCLPQQHVFAVAARHGAVALEVQQDDAIGDWGTSHTFLFRKTPT